MSAATAFMEDLKNGPGMEPDEDVFKGIWEQYERVIIRSLITSFGLDFLVKDQHGGDVDTVHNVRQIGNDPNMKYKNKQNETDYEKRKNMIRMHIIMTPDLKKRRDKPNKIMIQMVSNKKMVMFRETL